MTLCFVRTRYHVDIGGLDLVVRAMGEDDLEGFQALTREAGLHATPGEQRAFLRHCSALTVGAFIQPTCQLICGLVALPLSDGSVLLAQFVTAAAYRRRGVGGHVLQRTLQSLGGTNLVVNAMPVGLSTYLRHGFKVDNIGIYKFEGQPRVPHDLASDAHAYKIEPITPENADEVADYERRVCRSGFGRLPGVMWTLPEVVYARLLRDADGQVAGTLSVWKRPERAGLYRMARFYAASYAHARRLFADAMTALPVGASIQIYCPRENEASHTDLIGEFGLSGLRMPGNNSELVQLYTREANHQLQFSQLFSVYMFWL